MLDVFPEVFGCDTQFAFAVRRGSDKTCHIQRHRQDKTEVVIRVLADEVHAPRAAEALHIPRGPVDAFESFAQEARFAIHSMIPPKMSIPRPL